MITIQFMKPFYQKRKGNELRLVFAYQYLSIMKDDEVFHFIPIEGKEILVDLEQRQVTNLSEVLVFQRGNRFLRIPLYQLLLISNIHEFLAPHIEEALGTGVPKEEREAEEDIEEETLSVLKEIELQNLERLIDRALEEKNEEKFYELATQKKSLI